ncbi:universal stress protein [Naumannella halotolerans]|uniref:Nucleotide-binding universal stress UspA family protein n=1 Tax=Naumannella halotolerans TaxID=993414 RepID=A0A4R7J6B7_9ACTN|nr:universal stress protein [Naumannella halotolerans]TDT32932.1 nucleotide-binding universal stress UspA family protein [Naumannella halotolerans]
MSVVVGYIPEKGGRGSLDLGLQLAAALGESLTVATVVPRQWTTPSMARVDAEFADYARTLGENSERQAQQWLSETSVDVPTTYVVSPGRSVTSALLAAMQTHDATMLVLGSSTDGALGRIVVGSTADKLLHSSPVPLAISPRGYRSTASDGFSRVTCAFSDTPESRRLVADGVEFAARLGVPVRVASFGVRGATMYPPSVGLSAEDSVLTSWREQVTEAQQHLRTDKIISEQVETVVGTGPGWSESMAGIEWLPDELLLIGSSAAGPLTRVFLGSRASKLVRHSPVPTVVMPRSG